MKTNSILKKHLLICIVIILLFALFIYLYFKPTNYKLEYNINNVAIVEEYNKTDDLYYFTLSYKNMEYKLLSLDNYTTKRKLIADIQITEENDSVCLDVNSQNIQLYSVCSKNAEYFFDFQLNDFTINDNYENINIDTLDDNKYLLWNYNEFIFLDNQNKDKLEIFNRDIYNLNLYYIYENYLLVPDYDSDYKFDKFYLINVDNKKITEIKLRFELYFDSYFLGNYKDNIYIFDNKAEQLYYINISKKEIYKSKNQILVNGNWENISTQKLKNDKSKFKTEVLWEYTLDNGNLYLEYNNFKVKVTNFLVSQIIKTNGLEVYFVANDILYKYDPYHNLQAIMQYSEWNFNSQNMIFIFN